MARHAGIAALVVAAIFRPVVAAVARTVAAPSGRDAGLLALVEAFEEADRQDAATYFNNMKAIEAAQLPPSEDFDRKLAVLRASQARTAELDMMLRRISATPGYTPEGRAAKARVVQRWLADCWDLLALGRATPWELLAYSLTRDVELAAWEARA